MHAIDLITPDVPPLRPQDDVGRALDWMEEFKVGHLPVVNEGRLVGMVTQSDVVAALRLVEAVDGAAEPPPA